MKSPRVSAASAVFLAAQNVELRDDVSCRLRLSVSAIVRTNVRTSPAKTDATPIKCDAIKRRAGFIAKSNAARAKPPAMGEIGIKSNNNDNNIISPIIVAVCMSAYKHSDDHLE